MPIPFVAHVISGGLPFGLTYWGLAKVASILFILTIIKTYSNGAKNTSERNMHSKVIMITGGTTGIGQHVALALASRGAQLILLTHEAPSDPFLIDYITDLRTRSSNDLIYAEHCDLSSLYSIRKFATKWIDNAPPRRLDMIILLAATFTPPGKQRRVSGEGVEESWMVNYLGNFQLLSILSPAIRAQTADRDVRVVVGGCVAYIRSPALYTNSVSNTSGKDGVATKKTKKGKAEEEEEHKEALSAKEWSPTAAFARSKFALVVFAQAFQKHLDAYKRPDSMPMNARVIVVDPGYSRTAGMRRWLSRGTLWGLGVYLSLWSVAWLFLKSAERGAEGVLYAAMEASLSGSGIDRGRRIKLIKECIEVDFGRNINDEEQARRLWEGSEKLVERIEREEAVRRALAKKEREVNGEGSKSSIKVEKIVEDEKEKTGFEEGAAASGAENKKASRRARKKAA